MDSARLTTPMARTRNRSPSLDSPEPTPLIKRLKTAHLSSSYSGSLIISDDTSSSFADGLFDHKNIARLNSGYLANEPFKYAVVEKLFQDHLLQKVKDECLSELNFTEKETDIYKVNQTGDLASLNFLSKSQISRLPNLLALRDALYSPQFRNFLRAVTGCGPLSGKKQDMSVNSYTRGCHLLNHDDAIGTRRVSYILYMPLPHYQMWQQDWGGALELYPARINDQGQPEPEPIPAKCIPPSWNQFIFFEVQPGKSFHAVEEVVVGGEEDGRERLSISGWFHAPQEGEEGYAPEESTTQIQTSREQLTASTTQFKPYPSSTDDDDHDEEIQNPDVSLPEAYLALLAEFLNPVYLKPRTMKALAARFVEESSLELHSFLNSALADSLEARLRDLDARDGLGEDRARRIPPHASATKAAVAAPAACGWSLKGPPHKWRYCVLDPPPENGKKAEAVTPRAHASSADELMRSLQNELFPSLAFRSWLAVVTRLMPMRHAVEARRFRPGLDYTLATSEDSEARLDVVLGLTPPVREPACSPSSSSSSSSNNYSSDEDDARKSRGGSRRPHVKRKRLGKEENRGWATAEWGGWECYMAPHNEEDDPAIYRSGVQKKQPKEAVDEGGAAPKNGHSDPSSSKKPKTKVQDHMAFRSPSPSRSAVSNASQQDAEMSEEDDDSTLLTVQAGYNRLLLVLRDERVMRFVKYVSAAAVGSRWDVCGEYEVGMLEEEEEDE